jgi:hypothetical protein
MATHAARLENMKCAYIIVIGNRVQKGLIERPCWEDNAYMYPKESGSGCGCILLARDAV